MSKKLNKKNSAKSIPTTCNIRVIDETRSYLIEEGDGEKWGRRDCYRVTHDIRGIQIADHYYDLCIPFIPTFEKPYYLVYAIYDTGDSFGHDEGSIDFIDLFETREKALKARDAVREGKMFKSYGMDNRGYEYVTETGETIQCGFAPWEGYFESLDRIDVDEVWLDTSPRI